jgi:ABC-2 type transport system ATP-binding protein
MTELVYRLCEVTKRYGEVLANDALDIDIRRGELVCLLGPNGAGKTTVVRQLLGLTRPTSGRIELLGAPLGDGGAQPSQVCAYLPQGAYPFREARVEEAVRLSAMLRGRTAADAARDAAAEIERWGLEEKQDRAAGHLSGGERRLLGIACALVGDREVLVMDEPTNDLDPLLRARLWSHLADQRRQGRTVVLISHNVFEVEAIASLVIIMARGRVVAEGTSEAIRSAATPEFVVQAPYRGSVAPRLGRSASVHDGVLRVVAGRTDLRTLVAAMAADEQVEVEGLRVLGATLQDAYLMLTSPEAGQGSSEDEVG